MSKLNFTACSCYRTSLFEYADTEYFLKEISEWYSYQEALEFAPNYEHLYEIVKEDLNWKKLSLNTKTQIISKLLDKLDCSDELVRSNAIKAVLYLTQGCWKDYKNCEIENSIIENCLLLQSLGAFEVFLGLFNLEINKEACKDDFKNVLTVLYHITESFRCLKESGRNVQQVETFISSLDMEESLVNKLMTALSRWCYNKGLVFPVKKMLLLMWKLILIQLGGMDTLRQAKKQKRKSLGLGEVEDTIMTGRNVSNKTIWTAKVSNQDVLEFLNNKRMKYFGFQLPDDADTVIGLPEAVQQTVISLKKHLYVSLSELQLLKAKEIDHNPVESLYCEMLPNFSKFVGMFSKIIHFVTLNDLDSCKESSFLPFDTSGQECIVSNYDMKRQKEIISKAIAALLMLLMKHFKLNHIYQFEYLAQHLVVSSFPKLILTHICQQLNNVIIKNDIEDLVFPNCLLQRCDKTFKEQIITLSCLKSKTWCFDHEKLSVLWASTNDSIVKNNSQITLSSRQIHTFINLLRVLNKLVKNKDSRLKLIIDSKTAQVLIKLLGIKDNILRIYVLKLFKMHLKDYIMKDRLFYLKTITLMAHNVRQHLFKDFNKYTNSNFKSESQLLANVILFNKKRYGKKEEKQEVKEPELTEEFKKHYQLWLQHEVFENPINWDEFEV